MEKKQAYTEKEYQIAFGEVLKKYRQSKGWTLQEMSERMKASIRDVTFQALSQYENGRRSPKMTTLEALTTVLGVSYDTMKKEAAQLAVEHRMNAEKKTPQSSFLPINGAMQYVS